MKFLSDLFFLGLFLSGFANAAHNHSHHTTGPVIHDRPSVHGMLAFGKSKIYLSHLPMFHSPHDYQLIVEAEVSDPGLYAETEASLAAGEYMTIVPEKFSLTEMMANPKPFRAELVKGHFERGGVSKGEVTFKITKILYAKKFDGKKLPKEEYFYFGEGNEMFGVHIISAAPDFDHIVSVKQNEDGSMTHTQELYFETGDLAH